jgi:hypothetical protein
VSANQDNQIRQLLARLEVTSNAPISGYQPVGSKSAFKGRPPSTGDRHPPHLLLAEEYNRASGDVERGRVIVRAERVLRSLTHSPPVPVLREESVGERSKRLLEFGEGLAAQRVATALRVPLREVHRARVGAGRDREFGLVLETQAFLSKRLQSEERKRRVFELKAKHPGMTARQIAALVRADPKTVKSDLEEAA